MPYKTGGWGEQAQFRSKRRKQYFLSKLSGKLVPAYPFMTGGVGESIAEKVLPGIKKNPHLSNIDFDYLGRKLEVKTAKPTLNNKHYPTMRWYFTIKSQIETADLFLLICLNTEGGFVKAYLIPQEKILSKVSISLPVASTKLDDYLMKVG